MKRASKRSVAVRKTNGSDEDSGIEEDEKLVTGSSLIPIIASLMIDLISFTVILPLFPSILDYYKTHDDSGAYKFLAKKAINFGNILGAPAEPRSESVLIGGMLGSLFCMLQFISAPILGSISDHKGRRFALIICLIGISISHLLWLVSWNFGIFILSRVIGGFSRANVSICSTIVADDCPAKMRPKGMAFIGVAFSVGFTVGPAIGAYFAKSKSLYTPAFASLMLSLISLLIVVIFVKETLPESSRAKKSPYADFAAYIWPPHVFNFKLVSVGNKLKPIGLAYFVYIFIYSGLEFTLTFLTQAKLRYSTTDQGRMFMFIGITMSLLQGSLTRRLTPAMESGAVMIAMLLMIPAFLIIAFCQDTAQLLLGLFCYSIGSAIISPCLTSITASKVVRPNEKGVALGIFRSLGALARSFGPMAASALFWSMGPTTAYVIGAVCFILPLYLFKKATMIA